MTNDAEKLATIFECFPGIGPRQARRFVYFLLKSGNEYRSNLESALHNMANSIHHCQQCQRYYASDSSTVCGLCGNEARSAKELLIVEKDADLDQIEKSGAYSGRYFVLGSGVKLTDNSGQVPRQAQLLTHIKGLPELTEIIVAMPTTTEGEHASNAVRTLLQSITDEQDIKITLLGRGLSTGAELEYADSATLKSALESRS